MTTWGTQCLHPWKSSRYWTIGQTELNEPSTIILKNTQLQNCYDHHSAGTIIRHKCQPITQIALGIMVLVAALMDMTIGIILNAVSLTNLTTLSPRELWIQDCISKVCRNC